MDMVVRWSPIYTPTGTTPTNDMSGYNGNGIMGPMGSDNNWWVSGSNCNPFVTLGWFPLA